MPRFTRLLVSSWSGPTMPCLTALTLALGACASGGGGAGDTGARVDAFRPEGTDAFVDFPDAVATGEDAFSSVEDDAHVATPDGGTDTGPLCVDDDADGFSVGPASCGQIDCDDGDGAVNPGAVETCNGVDDDCDSSTDEDIATQTCGVGGCEVTVPGCTDGAVPTCTPGAPTTETCNAIDDDCNGTVDDGLGAPIVCGVGACQAMVPGCASGSTPMCTPGMPGTETCNGVDDDCDGTVDDGLPTASCGIGACMRTVPTCVGGMPQACVPGMPGTEVCNGLDDDCDGTADDGFGTTTCGVGSCRRTVSDCVGGMPQTCTPASPGTEICNNLDDDCDGTVDDGLGSLSCGLGSCARTVTACLSGVPQTCTPGTPSSEVCGNGVDENCNGVADDGCVTAPTNDLCSGAIVLSGSSGTRTGDSIAGATQQLSDCAYGTDLFYQIAIPARSILYVDTFGSSFDTSLSIRSSCAGATLACEDDDCLTLQDIAVVDVPAGTYYIVVHTRSYTTGTINLRWQTMTTGAGTSARVTANGTFSGTTGSLGYTNASATCFSVGAGPENLHYFTVCPSTTRTVTVTTCSLASFDTVLYLRSANGTEVACNDDYCSLQSQVSGTVTGPGLFGAFVDTYSSTLTGQSYSVTFSGL